MVGPWRVRERCPGVPMGQERGCPSSHPPPPPPARRSPGPWQGAGISRSTPPSRCSSNHALITALGKFTVWSRRDSLPDLDEVANYSWRREGGGGWHFGRGESGRRICAPKNSPRSTASGSVCDTGLLQGVLGMMQRLEVGAGGAQVCVPPGLPNTEPPQTKPLGWMSPEQRAGEGRWGGEPALEQEWASQVLGCRGFQPPMTPRVCGTDAPALAALQPRTADADGSPWPSQSTHTHLPTPPKGTRLLHLKEQQFAVVMPTSMPRGAADPSRGAFTARKSLSPYIKFMQRVS